jgi:FkbM family methyltransferase
MHLNLAKISGQSMLGKLLRLPLALIPRGVAVPVVQGPLRGARWIVGSSTHGCWVGCYEFTKQRLFARTVRPGQVVYDIGANVGFYTLLASVLVGPTGRVLAFEPLPRNVAYLRTHVELNHCHNTTVVTAAVSDTMGTARFDGSGDGSMAHLATDGAIAVETVTLDNVVFAQGEPPPHVIKIDVEGAEMAVLRGGQQTIETYRPTIFLALHGPELQRYCYEWLRSRGYQLVPITGTLEQSDEIVAVGTAEEARQR